MDEQEEVIQLKAEYNRLMYDSRMALLNAESEGQKAKARWIALQNWLASEAVNFILNEQVCDTLEDVLKKMDELEQK